MLPGSFRKIYARGRSRIRNRIGMLMTNRPSATGKRDLDRVLADRVNAQERRPESGLAKPTGV